MTLEEMLTSFGDAPVMSPEEIRKFDEWHRQLNNRIKPCPRCGGKAFWEKMNNGGELDCCQYVMCEDCCFLVGPYPTPEEAVDTWNLKVN